MSLPDCVVTFCDSNEGTAKFATTRILLCENGHYMCRDCFLGLFRQCQNSAPFNFACPKCRSGQFNEAYYAIASQAQGQTQRPKKYLPFQ